MRKEEYYLWVLSLFSDMHRYVLKGKIKRALKLVMSSQRFAKVGRLAANEEVVFVQDFSLCQLLVLKRERIRLKLLKKSERERKTERNTE